MKALEILARKLRPDLAQQQLSGDPEQPLFPKQDETDTRDLARSIFEVLRQAKMQPEEPSEPRALPAPPPSVQEQSPAAPDFMLGESEVFDNGAMVQLIEIEGSGARKWEVTDALGAHHSFKRDREDARRLAESLPSYGHAVAATAANGGAAP
jgi:hypothetical protein